MSTSDFWSRRKAAVAEEEKVEVSRVATAELEAERAALADKPEAEVLEELGLPDPDSLEKGADFSVFLQSRVPEAIRRRALRRLWRSNPVLANLDGLNDYDDDYARVDTPLGGLKTAYKVGRGFLRSLPEDPRAAEETLENVKEDLIAAENVPEVDIAVAEIADADEDANGPDTAPEEEQFSGAGSARRMRFRFLD